MYSVLDKVSMMKALKYGPVIVLFHANQRLKNYSGGIFDMGECEGRLNHAILIVGYNLQHDPPYFIALNNWGEHWGERGYFRFKMGDIEAKSGMCEMFSHSSNMLLKFSK